jgi:hypothetical protein
MGKFEGFSVAGATRRLGLLVMKKRVYFVLSLM